MLVFLKLARLKENSFILIKKAVCYKKREKELGSSFSVNNASAMRYFFFASWAIVYSTTANIQIVDERLLPV